MRRFAVESSCAREIGYDPARHVLEILYSNGKLYDYFGVSRGEFLRLMRAQSLGKFINQNIKTSHHYRPLD